MCLLCDTEVACKVVAVCRKVRMWKKKEEMLLRGRQFCGQGKVGHHVRGTSQRGLERSGARNCASRTTVFDVTCGSAKP